jgi:hypothetical protein
LLHELGASFDNLQNVKTFLAILVNPFMVDVISNNSQNAAKEISATQKWNHWKSRTIKVYR